MADDTSNLILKVKQKATIPNSGVAYSDDVIVSLMDLAMRSFIAPEMTALMEEHFIVTMDVQLPNTNAYSGTTPTDVKNVIDIPPNAMGMRLRDVQVIGSDGQPSSLMRLTLTQAAAQNGNLTWGTNMNIFAANQTLGGFYLQGNQVEIYPYGLASGKLIRLFFEQAPNELILTQYAGQITSILGDVVQVNQSLPWLPGTHVCAISQYNPHGFVRDVTVPTVVYASYPSLSDVVLVNAVGNILTFPTGVTAGLTVGDWICPEGQSVFAMNIPREMLPALIQKTAESILEAAGDRPGQELANATYEKEIALARTSLSPRAIGKPIINIPMNSPFRAVMSTSLGRY